jgi:hypothetical protein
MGLQQVFVMRLSEKLLDTKTYRFCGEGFIGYKPFGFIAKKLRIDETLGVSSVGYYLSATYKSHPKNCLTQKRHVFAESCLLAINPSGL